MVYPSRFPPKMVGREGLLMIKKFLLKLTISAIILLAFSLKFNDVTIGENIIEYPLETAWKATGLPIKEIATESWMRVGRQWQSIPELKDIAGRVKRQLSLTVIGKETTGGNGEFCYISFEGRQSDQTSVAVTIQSLFSDGVPETQMGISTSHEGEIANLRSYIKSIQASIEGLGSDVRFNLMLEGERAGKLAPDNIREISSLAFRRIHADLVDAGHQGPNSSYKGYTRLLNQAIRVNSQKINIEFGTRYDPARNSTHVLMATPNLQDGI